MYGVGGDMDANHDSQPMDMKGTMDMTKESAAVHIPYNSKTALST